MPIMETFLGKSGSRTVFMIECINGKSIQKYSFFDHENEILLVPGTCLRVVDKCSLGEGLHMIRLKETIPSHTLLQPPFGSSPSITSVTPQNETQPKSKHDEAIFAKLQVVKKVDVRGCGSTETIKLFYKLIMYNLPFYLEQGKVATCDFSYVLRSSVVENEFEVCV